MTNRNWTKFGVDFLLGFPMGFTPKTQWVFRVLPRCLNSFVMLWPWPLTHWSQDLTVPSFSLDAPPMKVWRKTVNTHQEIMHKQNHGCTHRRIHTDEWHKNIIPPAPPNGGGGMKIKINTVRRHYNRAMNALPVKIRTVTSWTVFTPPQHSLL